MEGVAFASMRNIDLMQSRGCHLDRMVTAAGRAKTRLWLEIKASIYDCPILAPRRAGVWCGRLGVFSNLESAVSELVRYDGEIAPNRAWSGAIPEDAIIV
jgi:xylulokinase